MTRIETLCPHRACHTRIPDGQFACKPHWFELPLSLRTRINTHYRAGRLIDHRAAVLDALRYWNPRTRTQLRCHHCKTVTDLIDDETGRPECVDCAKTELDQTADRHATPSDTLTCPSCHRETGMLISVDSDPSTCPACRKAD